ncbi:hypothetical protein Ahy_B04g069091 isoform B [Arachis hypogaea]|uniref:Uncharacterized protein n=1 Tax=Arachis hypogaea TaxID=3818 RepID=A0A444ZBN2_ARAHY|nr:hypothetical protein Ahy_B04g069091 isoform B [Arachis hypogaea]
MFSSPTNGMLHGQKMAGMHLHVPQMLAIPPPPPRHGPAPKVYKRARAAVLALGLTLVNAIGSNNLDHRRTKMQNSAQIMAVDANEG